MIKELSLLLVIIFCLLIYRNKKEFFKNSYDFKKIYGDIHHEKYLKSCRFDLMAKYLYVKSKDKKFETKFFKNLYVNHMLSFNNCYEKSNMYSLNNKKNKCEDFIINFDKLINNIKNNGFSKNKPIPVGENDIIINGAHRLITSYYFNTKSYFINVNDKESTYNYDYFLRRTKHRKLDRIYADSIALEYIKHNRNIRTMIIYPLGYNYNIIDKVYNIINDYGIIYYEKDIKLSKIGLNNLVNECYRGEDWIGGFFPNNEENGKTNKVKSDVNNVKVLLLDVKNLDKCVELKEKCRELYNMGKHSLHMSDNEEETFRIASSLLNKNSINYLNLGNNKISQNTKQNLLKYFKNVKADENFCLTSSIVLELYGLREANDLDYLNFNSIELGIENVSIHNKKWLSYYPVSRDEIIFNPKYHFYFYGHKVATLEVIKKMKEQRKENKDIKDINLIKKFI
jgi:hypothetical protein